MGFATEKRCHIRCHFLFFNYYKIDNKIVKLEVQLPLSPQKPYNNSCKVFLFIFISWTYFLQKKYKIYFHLMV